MTMAVAKTAAHAGVSSFGNAPSGMGKDENSMILILLVISTGVVFIQHDRSGQAQSGNQYIAIGVVGFILLVVAQFWPYGALSLASLFTLAIILNSPNGVPLVGGSSKAKQSVASGGSGGSASNVSTVTNSGGLVSSPNTITGGGHGVFPL